MGFFNRRSEPRATAPTATTNVHRAERRHAEPYAMGTRPTFGEWLRFTWLDIATMVVMGAIGLGVYFADPAPNRSFAVQFKDGEVVYPQFAYPMRKEIVPIWAAALLGSLVPIVVIIAMQVRVRSFWDANNAIIGLLYALIGAAVFQVFVKWLIGGLRPHFLTVCKPDISLASASSGIAQKGYSDQGYSELYFTREICTGKKSDIDDSLESMPSGHTTAAFAGFVFLYLYLNAKLKVFSNYHPAMWKLIAIYAPILGACLIGGALTIDEFHNWYDILAGAVIGTMFAFSSYRMCYAAIWDWRWNHIPLHRNTPFIHGEHELSHAVFTRKAGWGNSGAAFGGEKYGAHGAGHHGSGHGAGLGRKPVGSGTSPEHMV